MPFLFFFLYAPRNLQVGRLVLLPLTVSCFISYPLQTAVLDMLLVIQCQVELSSRRNLYVQELCKGKHMRHKDSHSFLVSVVYVNYFFV
jgi:hypothetical protein